MEADGFEQLPNHSHETFYPKYVGTACVLWTKKELYSVQKKTLIMHRDPLTNSLTARFMLWEHKAIYLHVQ